MSSSLREQLLKAGLVSSDQVKKADSAQRKQKHQFKKDKRIAREVTAKKQAEQKQQLEQEQAKRAYDRSLNLQRDAKQKRREQLASIRQLLIQHRQNKADAELAYNFQAGKVVRKVRVTEQQKQQLGAGRLGIVRNPQDEFDFVLLPRPVALKIAAIEERALVLLYDEGSEEDDWGDIEWPDDL